MTARGFEELRVYQMAEKLSDAVWKIVATFTNLARDTVGKQAIRSADSVGANIAEGYGRGTYQDNKRFVRIARGSLYETRHWMRRAYARKLLNRKDVDLLTKLMADLGPSLNAYLRSIGPKPNDQ